MIILTVIHVVVMEKPFKHPDNVQIIARRVLA